LIKAYEAVTREIDDVELAVSEIFEQLAPMKKDASGQNAVGILSCYAEYVESGVVAALSEQLPFDIVGTTTIANSSHYEIGESMLTLLVIVSDDVSFATALSDPLDQEEEAPLRSCYEAALAKLGNKPAFMMSFFPLLTSVSGEYYTSQMSAITDNLPNFGTIAVDHNGDYHDSMVVYNGEPHRDRLTVLLFAGNISPRFYIGNISKERVYPDKGFVTGAMGCQINSVNHAPVTDYLLSLGLKKKEDGSIAGINSFPLIVDYGDGTPPVARALIGMTPEGAAICSGAVPMGSILSIGSFSAEEIVATTGFTVDTVLEKKEHHVMLIYACVGRYFAQGLVQTAEMRRMVECLKPADIPYMAAYAGGEFCPVYTPDGATANRLHGHSVIICAI
jgi:hypothetical protein